MMIEEIIREREPTAVVLDIVMGKHIDPLIMLAHEEGPPGALPVRTQQ